VTVGAGWAIPGDTCAVSMFNPFTGQAVRAAAGKVFASHARRPPILRILYYHPWEDNWLVLTGRMAAEDARPSAWLRRGWWRTGRVIVIYWMIPERSRSGPPHRRTGRRALQRWSKPNPGSGPALRRGKARRGQGIPRGSTRDQPGRDTAPIVYTFTCWIRVNGGLE